MTSDTPDPRDALPGVGAEAGPPESVPVWNQPPPRDHAVDEEANLRINTWHGAAQNAAVSLVSPYLGIDLLRLGGTNFEVGLLSSLPPLASTISTLLGARWIAGTRHPSRVTTWVFSAARAAFLGFVLLNWLRGGATPLLFVLLVGAMSVPVAVATVSWQAIITALFRPEVRGSAIANRTRAASFVGVVVTMLGGLAIGGAPGTTAYGWLFLCGAAVAVLEVWLFSRLKGDPRVQTLPPNLWQASRRLFRRPVFRDFTLASLPFYLGWVMAWPLFIRYEVNIAHANNFWIAAYAATNGLASAVTSRMWGRVASRIGVSRALALSAAGLAFVPFTFALHPNLYGLLIQSVIGGAMGSGVNQMLLLRQMEVVPEEDRIVGMGVANTLVGVAGVVGPLLATALAVFIPMPGVFFIPFAFRLGGGLAFLAASLRAGRRRGRVVPEGLGA
jgi:MFS family permease